MYVWKGKSSLVFIFHHINSLIAGDIEVALSQKIFLDTISANFPSDLQKMNTSICFICKEMADTRPWKHYHLINSPEARQTERCLLCNREFCRAHSLKESDMEEPVCEVNHKTYYRNHREFQDIYPSLEERKMQLRSEYLV
jgi:hypothetical protein